MNDFVQERNAALLSLDEAKIRRFAKKYGVRMPEKEEVFWASVHKAICHITAATAKQKRESALWLLEHGFFPGIRQ